MKMICLLQTTMLIIFNLINNYITMKFTILATIATSAAAFTTPQTAFTVRISYIASFPTVLLILLCLLI